jgi:hypothetical protein
LTSRPFPAFSLAVASGDASFVSVKVKSHLHAR